MDEEFEKLRNKWYHTDSVSFEIIKTMKYKESVFLKKGLVIRNLKIDCLMFFWKNTERYHFFEEDFNLYSSLAQFKNMPMFSFNQNKKREQSDEWNINFKKYMVGYDLLLDFDSEKDLNFAYSDTFRVKEIFDKRKIPYNLKFSGKKGFHIMVEYKHFPIWMKEMDYDTLVNTLKEFAENLSEKHKLNFLDKSIIDIRRICKTPYSVVYPYYFVALPLSDEQFENFNLKIVSLPYLLENIDNIKYRGLLTRHENSDTFGDMVKEYNNI